MRTPTLRSQPRPRRQPGLGGLLRVLVLHQHYWPETAATAQILSDLCEDLAAAGHQVTVVSGHPSYRKRLQCAALEVHRGVTIRRVATYSPSERTVAQRLLHYGSYFVASTARLVLEQRSDVCLVMSTPPLLLGVSGLLGRLTRGIPFVYCVQDLYPDIAVHLGVLQASSAVARAAELVARGCYRAAAAVVTLSPGMATQLAKKGVPAERLHVIPNWSDTDAVRPTARESAFAAAHGLTDRFVVQYSGNLGLSQGLEHLIGAAEQLRHLPITFALFGDGAARAALQQEAAARGLDQVRFFPAQPRARLSELLGACDVGLVTMKEVVGQDLVPSKLYGIMAAGRPVVAAVGARSEVARVLTDHECGWIVPPESAGALANGIRAAFKATPAERRRLGKNGRRACEREYARTALTQRYEQVLLSVLDRDPSSPPAPSRDATRALSALRT